MIPKRSTKFLEIAKIVTSNMCHFPLEHFVDGTIVIPIFLDDVKFPFQFSYPIFKFTFGPVAILETFYLFSERSIGPGKWQVFFLSKIVITNR